MPIVQVVTASTSSLQTINTGWVIDASIPQKTEGIEILTCTLTPTNANNLLVVKAFAFGDPSNATECQLAIFQDAGSNALSTSFANCPAGAGWCSHTTIFFSFAAGTTSSTTIKLRAASESYTWYINGIFSGSRLYGGAATAYLEVMEVKV
jgi:hypothetical protein